VIAIEGNFAYSFLLGVLAAVNPCGFVLLPTYLLWYLGTEIGADRTGPVDSLRRGLSVGAAVSSGFVLLFVVVGVVSRAFTTVIQDNAKYAALVVGIALVAAGVAMLGGWKPPVLQPNVSLRREHTFRNMFLFGLVYAVASIGCTIGLLTSVIMGSVGRQGYVSGVLSIALYGIGMAALVTSLTVGLAFARVGLLSALRRGLPWFDRVSAVAVLLTGLYLAWYWWGAITERGSDAVTGRVDDWQTRIVEVLEGIGAWRLATVFLLVIGSAAAWVWVRGSRSPAR
jgi:cytochrome c biogenesis protein CcdA